ncbi:ABC transporter permease [Paenibacillus roseipurpureus]|uniref:ABC transporter permease subunit n=1 Tax=Paenibacillus roseopurpureus TaxID=2918901 RepID=A0AA96LQ98_9BACL|nr:ABC transporter permease subunit [Paenibacillus sp. MBLB1832]WNR42895.1 ABC transporter permease subunit [Paenibacillus sp. MBLB1832]
MPASEKTTLAKLVKYRTLLFMLLPGFVFFFLFSYIPMSGAIIAFKKMNYTDGIWGSPWAGFENFKFLFMSGNLSQIIRNTALYNLAFIFIGNALAITIGIMLAEVSSKLFRKWTQSLLFVPYFISWVVVGAFIYSIFNFEFGFMNSILAKFHLEPINVYDRPMAWVGIIISSYLWKNVGYFTVIYLAAIMGIDQGMYEAAEIDGANVFQRIRYIIVPSLMPTTIVLVLLALGNVFRGDFNMFFQIVGDNAVVYNYTDVIDTFVTRSLMKTREFGMSSAAGLLQSVLCFFLISTVNSIVRRVNKDHALY